MVKELVATKNETTVSAPRGRLMLLVMENNIAPYMKQAQVHVHQEVHIDMQQIKNFTIRWIMILSIKVP
jgi:hypothetical protein